MRSKTVNSAKIVSTIISHSTMQYTPTQSARRDPIRCCTDPQPASFRRRHRSAPALIAVRFSKHRSSFWRSRHRPGSLPMCHSDNSTSRVPLASLERQIFRTIFSKLAFALPIGTPRQLRLLMPIIVRCSGECSGPLPCTSKPRPHPRDAQPNSETKLARVILLGSTVSPVPLATASCWKYQPDTDRQPSILA